MFSYIFMYFIICELEIMILIKVNIAILIDCHVISMVNHLKDII